MYRPEEKCQKVSKWKPRLDEEIHSKSNYVLKTIIRDTKGNLMYKSHQIVSYADKMVLLARDLNEPKNIAKEMEKTEHTL